MQHVYKYLLPFLQLPSYPQRKVHNGIHKRLHELPINQLYTCCIRSSTRPDTNFERSPAVCISCRLFGQFGHRRVSTTQDLHTLRLKTVRSTMTVISRVCLYVCTWFNYIPRSQVFFLQIEYKRGYPTAFKPAVHPSGDGERDPEGCLDVVDNQPLHKIRDQSMCMAVGGSLAPKDRFNNHLGIFSLWDTETHHDISSRCAVKKRRTQRVDTIHQGGVKGPRSISDWAEFSMM